MKQSNIVRLNAWIFGIVGVTFFIVFAAIGYVASYFTSEPNTFLHHADDIIQSLCVVINAWILSRLFNTLVWKHYERRRGHSAPKILIDIVKLLIIVGAVLLILVVIYQKPVLSIITAGSVITAGLAFSIKELVLDVCSSFILDIERPFKIGDWIELGGKTEGQVVDSGWRRTKIFTHEKKIVYIPNGHLVKEIITNYSQPEPFYCRTLEITIGHNVPVDRATRILYAATLSVPELHERGCHVFAIAATEKGIVYTIRYLIKDHGVWRPTQHAVIEAVTEHLHASGLRISEDVGQYALKRAKQDWEKISPLSVSSILKKVDILAALSDEILQHLAENVKEVSFKKGENVVTQGEDGSSMFIIFEGVSEVVISIENEQQEISERIVALLGHNRYFGDRAFLLGEKRVATVRARSSLVVFELTKDLFKPVLQKDPNLVQKLSEIIIARDQELSDVVTDQQLKDRKNAVTSLMTSIKEFFSI
jgi:small-conductance mechanosensitive channel/CRP-like cAMP-binding protein